MTANTQQRRPALLPALVITGAVILARPVFIPGPAGARVPSQAVPNLAAAGAAVAVFASLPAVASVDDPLAHGAPGAMEDGVLHGIAEKCTFGGLLVATILAWWRGTLGKGKAADEGLPPSFYATGFANLSLVALLVNRWIESGHFPIANMYESLSFLAWGVTSATVYFTVMQNQQTEESQTLAASGATDNAEAKTMTGDIAAVWATPMALGIVAFAQLSLPKALQKANSLVPALQSNWLMMHVSVVMCAYATLLFGSVLCMAVLALSQPKESPVTALREAVLPALQSVANGLSPQPAPAVATSQAGTPAVAMTGTTGMDAGNTASSSEGTRQVAMASGGAVTVEFSSAARAGSAVLTKDDQLALTLDDLAYQSILLGFGFLTVGIISGAVWANEAWGNYWSWDPKETWALIAWLVYAGYLHTRLQLGWDSRDSAKIGAFGFLVVWVCYIGVNLMGLGLHSYGFFLK